MILYSKQVFHRDMLIPEDQEQFLKFVNKKTEMELCEKLINELHDHEPHIVCLQKPVMGVDPGHEMMSYKQILSNNKLVTCNKCKYNPYKARLYYDRDIIDTDSWCKHFVDHLNGGGYCSFGREESL